jgi:hypothetical protein
VKNLGAATTSEQRVAVTSPTSEPKPSAEVLVISFTDLKRDPRVNRQLDALRARYRVIAAGTGDPELEGVRFVGCKRAPRPLVAKLREAAELLLRRYETHYWGMAHILELRHKLQNVHVDLIVANDIEALPLALSLANGTKVIFDAHEYAPREFEERLVWRLTRQGYVRSLCDEYIHRASGMMTVADGIAEEYERNYGIRVVVVYNTPKYQALAPTETRGDVFRMIHHGNAMPARKLENMLEAMEFLDQRFRLDLMLLPVVPSYLESLKQRAHRDGRIRFLPPVSMQDLVSVSSAYDIGLYLLEPSSFNNLHALPNKFFEFIQSRLAIAIGPSPEMARLVERYDCGVVAQSFAPADMAEALMQLDAGRIDYFKRQADVAARELCFERSSEALLALVEQVLSRS